MKACAWCAEEIQDAAIVCRHCGRDQRTGRAEPHAAATLTLGGSTSTNVMAILSIVCSVGAFVILPVIGHGLGIYFGHRSKQEIADSRGAQTGESLATAGIVIGWIGVALFVVFLLAFCSMVSSVG